MKRTKLLIALLSALLAGKVVMAQVKVPRLVSDGMVLQREAPIRIWGWASPGEKITIKFDGETASGVTDDRGKWVVVLSPKKAGGPYAMDINGINHIWLKNIMVGEVWVCAGQSNMELPMERVKEKYSDIIAHSDNGSIRQFKVPQRYDSTGPRENLSGGKWESANPSTVPGFSAIAYFFARELNERYHVPVGLINTAAGDRPDEAWMSTNATGFYNGMIAPVVNYTIKGVIWYPGEADVSRASEYITTFPLLIADWRHQWNQGVFPFLFVQLEGYGVVKDQAEESNRAALRDAQRMALALPKTGMAATMDLGESNDMHPLNKADVSKRLMLAAEHVAYGRGNMIWTGPVYHSMKVKGDKVHVHFTEVENGLIVKGGGELHGFAVAGADNHFVPAKAVIEGKNVVVAWSESVPNPVAVRYAWADNPQGANLYNRDILFNDGLPAPSFAGRSK